MKFSKSVKFSLMLLAALILTPQQVWACACCAEDGQYRIGMNKPRNYEIELMERMRFGDTANVFTGIKNGASRESSAGPAFSVLG